MKAADPVGRKRDVELVGVGQAQVVHDVNELIPGLRQTRIEKLLFADGRNRLSSVVVRRVDPVVIGQAEDLLPDRVEEDRGVPLLEVGSPAAADQQSVSWRNKIPLTQSSESL